MFADVLPLLRCLKCGSELALDQVREHGASEEVVNGTVSCGRGHTTLVEEGVLAFSTEDAPSDPWSRSYKNWEVYLNANRSWISGREVEVGPILDCIPTPATNPMLDICTGQGGLLFNLLKRGIVASVMISLDMSLHVQRYNRRYMNEFIGLHPVTYIACDAATLPFKESVVGCVTSFGIGNMLNKMPAGLSEAARVLRRGGLMAFTHSYVGEDSKGWRTLKQVLEEMGGSDVGYMGLEREFVALMDRSGFREYDISIVREVVGHPDSDPEAGPILPYPNEKLTELLVRAWK